MIKITILRLFLLFMIFTNTLFPTSALEEEFKSNYKIEKEVLAKMKEVYEAAKNDFTGNRKDLFNAFTPVLKSKKLADRATKEYIDFVVNNDSDFKLYLTNSKYTLASSFLRKSTHDKDIKKRFENTIILELEKYSIAQDKNAKLRISQDLNFQNQGKIFDSPLLTIRVGGNLEISELSETKKWKLVASINNSEPSAHISEMEGAMNATEKTASKTTLFFLIYLLESYSKNIN